MNNFGRACLALIGAGVGFWVGVVLGVLVPYGFCQSVEWLTGSRLTQIGWILILTIPAGACFGFGLGGFTILVRPRWFAATFAPLFILVVAAQVTQTSMRNADRPRVYEMEVSGTPGEKYFGTIKVDGDPNEVSGELPAEFCFEAMRIEYAFTMIDAPKDAKISMKVRANGKEIINHTHSHVGLSGEVKCFGYDEKWGGTNRHYGIINPEDAAFLVKKWKLKSKMD